MSISPNSKLIQKECVICGNFFNTHSNKRSLKKKTCSKSCSSKLSYINQRTMYNCSNCSSLVNTSKSVINSFGMIYCNDCLKYKNQKLCVICKNNFYPTKKNTILCSQECITKYNNSNLVDIECYYCQKMFKQAKYNIYSGKRSFCSERCNNNQYSLDNPTRYGGTWTKWIKEIRKRDNNSCLKCGNKGKLEVHHFKKVRFFNDPNKAHYNDNLGLFCKECHNEIENIDIKDLNDFYRRYSPTL